MDSPEEIEGAALETLVFQEMRACNHYLDLNYKIFYWRTASQVEVDFVLYGENGLLAFEVKRKSRITSKDLRGLKLFKQDYPMAQLFLFYGGSQPLFEEGIYLLPIEYGIRKLPQILAQRSDLDFS